MWVRTPEGIRNSTAGSKCKTINSMLTKQSRGWRPLSFSNMAMGRAAGLGGHLAYGFKAFGRIPFSRSSSYCNAVASIARRFPIDTVLFLRTRICQLSDTLCNKRARLSSSVISEHLRPSSILPSAKVNGAGNRNSSAGNIRQNSASNNSLSKSRA